MTEAMRNYYNYQPEFTLDKGTILDRRAEICWEYTLMYMMSAKVAAEKENNLDLYYEILGMVTHDMRWCLCWGELLDLSNLHQQGLFREVIEDILDDINFHTDCQNLREGNYVAVYSQCMEQIA